MTSASWSFATARWPARFALALAPADPGLKHASAADGTLCGTDRYATACPPT